MCVINVIIQISRYIMMALVIVQYHLPNTIQEKSLTFARQAKSAGYDYIADYREWVKIITKSSDIKSFDRKMMKYIEQLNAEYYLAKLIEQDFRKELDNI